MPTSSREDEAQTPLRESYHQSRRSNRIKQDATQCFNIKSGTIKWHFDAALSIWGTTILVFPDHAGTTEYFLESRPIHRQNSKESELVNWCAICKDNLDFWRLFGVRAFSALLKVFSPPILEVSLQPTWRQGHSQSHSELAAKLFLQF